jgi:hypothetical protein
MMTTPLAILRESIRSVPAAVKYALGVAGLASVIAIVRSLSIDYRVAVFGTILVLLLVALLVVFARLSRLTAPGFRLLAMVFTWFALILVSAAAFAMFLSVFFRWPLDLQDWKDLPSVAQR